VRFLKEQYFEYLKQELIRDIEQLQWNNIQEICKRAQHYFQIFQSLHSLYATTCAANENSVIDDSENGPPNLETGYMLERYLKGGELKGAGVFVPESVIRTKGFKHGDFIGYRLLSESSGESRYDYYLIKKGAGTSPRKEIEYGIVEKKDSVLVVEHCYEAGEKKTIKLHEIPHSFVITEQERMAFDIREGDIVSIAYYEHNPQQYRIVWKYKSESIPYKAPQPSSVYKKKEAKEQEPEHHDWSYEELRSLLSGKVITVMGLEPRYSLLEGMIERAGGQAIFCSGLEEETRIESMIEKADFVVIMKLHVSHRGSTLAVKYAKKHEIPFSVSETNGVLGFIKALRNCAEKEAQIDCKNYISPN
jgi:hypothetical protein